MAAGKSSHPLASWEGITVPGAVEDLAKITVGSAVWALTAVRRQLAPQQELGVAHGTVEAVHRWRECVVAKLRANSLVWKAWTGPKALALGSRAAANQIEVVVGKERINVAGGESADLGWLPVEIPPYDERVQLVGATDGSLRVVVLGEDFPAEAFSTVAACVGYSSAVAEVLAQNLTTGNHSQPAAPSIYPGESPVPAVVTVQLPG